MDHAGESACCTWSACRNSFDYCHETPTGFTGAEQCPLLCRFYLAECTHRDDNKIADELKRHDYVDYMFYTSLITCDAAHVHTTVWEWVTRNRHVQRAAMRQEAINVETTRQLM